MFERFFGELKEEEEEEVVVPPSPRPVRTFPCAPVPASAMCRALRLGPPLRTPG